jgi:hypothetical protein
MADLQHKDAVAGMAQNPLLTTMLCVAFLPDSGQQRPDNPACRVDVYQRILERLLSGWKPDEETDPPPEGVIPAKIAILREMAFRFFPGVELDADELREFLWGEDGHFVALPEDDRLRQWLRAQGIPLEEELCRDGVLKCGRTGKYIFILPTFQEYLAALAFCRMIEDSKTRWDREVEIAGRRGSARDFLDHKAWDPRWQAVISMLTGLLHDPAPLLELLAEETEDDQFRYRLALAAWCVVDISLARRPQQRSLIDQITTEVFSVWWEHHRNTTTAVVPHLTRALPAIAAAGGIVSAPAGSGVPVIARLLELSRNVDPDVRRSAADAMGALGPGGARDDVIKRLLDLSRDKDYGVLRSAVRALGALGPMAARDDVINRLLELSMDEDCGVLRSAVRALGALGPAAARDDEITRLVDPSAGRELRSATAC